jgi:hypothetical protein
MKKCSVCAHKDHYQIDRDIINGVPYPTLSHTYGLKVDSLKDHKRYGHLSKTIQEGKKAEDEKAGLELNALLEECLEISLGSAREARQARDYRAIGSIMAGPYKAAEILSRANPDGDKEESGLQAMRAELKAMRGSHVETPTA